MAAASRFNESYLPLHTDYSSVFYLIFILCVVDEVSRVVIEGGHLVYHSIFMARREGGVGNSSAFVPGANLWAPFKVSSRHRIDIWSSGQHVGRFQSLADD